MAADIEFNVRNGMTVGANKHLVLDVNGALSGSDITCTTGSILSGGSDLIDLFDFSGIETTLASNSGNWQNTYTHVQSVSDTWGGADGYITNIGDGSTTSIDVTHNLNSTNLTYSLLNNNTNEYTSTKTVLVDSNTIRFVFTTAPTLNKFKAVVISTDGTSSGGSGGASYSVYTIETLPDTGIPGQTVLVSDGSDTLGPTMAYFYNDLWYRTLDNVIIKDPNADPNTLWSLANTTDTQLWLDAADSDSVVVVDDKVTQWTDRSGNNNHATQSSIARQATRGLNSLIFDGLDDGYNVTDASEQLAIDAAPLSLYMVIKGYSFLVAYTNKDRLLMYGDASGAGNKGFYINVDGANTLLGSGTTSTSQAIRNGEELYLLEYRKTPTSWHIRVNGTEIATGNQSGNLTFDRLGLKWTGTTSLTTFNGTMHEVAVVPTTDDRDKIEGYLAHKWDLESKLPADHAYKDAAPTI